MRSALALVAVLSAAPASAQDVTLTLEPPPGDLVLTASRDGEVRTHCPRLCEIVLDAGSLSLTLHRRGETEALVTAELTLARSSVARARVVDREAERIGGWLLVGLVAIPGAALAIVGLLWMLGGAAGDAGDVSPEAIAVLTVGDALFVAGLTVGLYLAFHFDDATLELD